MTLSSWSAHARSTRPGNLSALLTSTAESVITQSFGTSDARWMWQCLQTITDYKEKHRRKLPSDTSLLDKLNYLYARFEASNTEPCMSAPAVPDDCGITLSIADVSKTFKQVNVHKAARPDRLPVCLLRA